MTCVAQTSSPCDRAWWVCLLGSKRCMATESTRVGRTLLCLLLCAVSTNLPCPPAAVAVWSQPCCSLCHPAAVHVVAPPGHQVEAQCLYQLCRTLHSGVLASTPPQSVDTVGGGNHPSCTNPPHRTQQQPNLLASCCLHAITCHQAGLLIHCHQSCSIRCATEASTLDHLCLKPCHGWVSPDPVGQPLPCTVWLGGLTK